MEGGPARPGVAGTEVDLRTSDGLRLLGRWWPASGSPQLQPRDPVDENPIGQDQSGQDQIAQHQIAQHTALASVVIVHGFSASQDDGNVRALAHDLAEAGYDVLTYDARGHGGSEGWCGVGSTEHLDVAGAVQAAARRTPPVVLLGVSMGGVAVAGYLADPPGDDPAHTAVCGAVLVSTPSRWRMRMSPVGLLTALLTRTRLGRWLASRHMRVRIAPQWHVGEPLESLVARIDVPLVVVHGTGDRLLAVEHGQRLQAKAAGPSRLEIVEGMGHGIDVRSRAAALSAVGWVLRASRGSPEAAPTTRRAR